MDIPDNVSRAVNERRTGDLLALLRNPEAARQLRAGIQMPGAPGQRACLAQLCVTSGNVEALRVVAQARLPHFTIGDCCTVVATGDDESATTRFDLAEFAVDRGDPEALAVALEFEPARDTFARMRPMKLGTLHYAALVSALAAGSRNAAARMARCCEVFIAHAKDAPCESDSTSDGLRRMFVIGRYDVDDTADLATTLLQKYVAAGLFDVDAPMPDVNSLLGRTCTPLANSIGYGNATLAAALIDMGCDVDAARGAFPDVLAMAAARVAKNARRASETHAAVAEAVMRRRLREQATPGRSRVAEADPVPSRRMKAL